MYGAERRVLVVPLHQQRDALLALLESEDRDARRLQRRDRRADRRERRQRAPDGRHARDLPAARARDTRDLPALRAGHDERADAPLLARAHLDGHAVPCRQRDRTVVEHLRTVRGKAEHLVAGDGGEPPRRRAHARIGGINAVHVRINDTALRAEEGRERHGARVAAAAPERGDVSRRVNALKACREHDAPLRQLLPDALRAHASHVRAAVRAVRPDRHLPAGERDCRHTERGKRDRAEGHARGLPRGEQSVQLTRRRLFRQLAGAREQRVGRVALCAEHDHHVVPLLPGAPDDPHGAQQPLAVTHAAAAEFLYDKAHSSPLLFPAKK